MHTCNFFKKVQNLKNVTKSLQVTTFLIIHCYVLPLLNAGNQNVHRYQTYWNNQPQIGLFYTLANFLRNFQFLKKWQKASRSPTFLIIHWYALPLFNAENQKFVAIVVLEIIRLQMAIFGRFRQKEIIAVIREDSRLHIRQSLFLFIFLAVSEG